MISRGNISKKLIFERIRIPLSRVFAALIFFLAAVSQGQIEQRSPATEVILFLIGTILVGIGSLGRLWCTLYIAGNKTGTLVTEGPFSLCRNPLYFFSLLGGIGVGLATETLTFPLLIIVFFAFWYPLVIKNEETRLLELHGDKYIEYCRNVPRFLPSSSAFVEPENYQVRVRKFRKAIFDALWFIWLVGLLEVAEGLRSIGIVPTLMTVL